MLSFQGPSSSTLKFHEFSLVFLRKSLYVGLLIVQRKSSCISPIGYINYLVVHYNPSVYTTTLTQLSVPVVEVNINVVF